MRKKIVANGLAPESCDKKKSACKGNNVLVVSQISCSTGEGVNFYKNSANRTYTQICFYGHAASVSASLCGEDN